MARKFSEDINYYKILQVDPEADKLVIKNSYYTILNALCTHPDKGGDEEKTKIINEAYQILSSSELRREYDTFLVELARRKSHPYSISEKERPLVKKYREREDTPGYRLDPFGGIFSISDAFDRLFQDFFTMEPGIPYHQQEWNPPVNIYREKGDLFIKLEVPGMSWQDIHIEVKNDILTISGEKRREFPDRNEYLKVEFQYGSFRRSFQLPAEADPAKMNASLADGVLLIMIPGSSARKSRVIPITQL